MILHIVEVKEPDTTEPDSKNTWDRDTEKRALRKWVQQVHSVIV